MTRNDEYLSERRLIAFPFTDDAPGIDRGTGQGLPSNLVVDALFTLPSSFASKTLYLKRISATSSSMLFTFWDGTDDVITVVVAVSLSPGYPPYWLYGDTLLTPYGSDAISGQLVCDAVVARSLLLEYLATPVEFGTTLPLVESAVAIDNQSLKSITLYNMVGGTWVASAAHRGHIRIGSGHNIDMAYLGDTDTTSNVIITAGADLGLGRWPCTDLVISKPFKGVTPASGDVLIETDDCYELVPLPPPYANGTYQLQGRCQACCTCQDYADVSAVLADMADRLRLAKAELDSARTTYEDGVTKFNDELIPSYGTMLLSVTAATKGKYSKTGSGGGTRLQARLVIQISNKTEFALTFQTWGTTVPACTVDDVMIKYMSGATHLTKHVASIGIIPAEFTTIASGGTLSITVDMHMTEAQAAAAWAGTATTTAQEQTPGTRSYSLSAPWRCE